jgi:hypothetical protein
MPANYAFVFQTPKGPRALLPGGGEIPLTEVERHNAAVEANDLDRIRRRFPVVVYPKLKPSDPTGLAAAAIRFVPTVSLWNGRAVGRVHYSSTFRNPFGGTLTAVTWRAEDGSEWYGRLGGDTMALMSRPKKKKGERVPPPCPECKEPLPPGMKCGCRPDPRRTPEGIES